MDTQDKILSVVLDIQENMKGLHHRVEALEGVHHKTYDKLDGFLVLISRHEAEIASVRSKLERLEDRLSRLEKSRV